jgi:hypothetical protein
MAIKTTYLKGVEASHCWDKVMTPHHGFISLLRFVT